MFKRLLNLLKRTPKLPPGHRRVTIQLTDTSDAGHVQVKATIDPPLKPGDDSSGATRILAHFMQAFAPPPETTDQSAIGNPQSPMTPTPAPRISGVKPL